MVAFEAVLAIARVVELAKHAEGRSAEKNVVTAFGPFLKFTKSILTAISAKAPASPKTFCVRPRLHGAEELKVAQAWYAGASTNTPASMLAPEPSRLIPRPALRPKRRATWTHAEPVWNWKGSGLT